MIPPSHHDDLRAGDKVLHKYNRDLGPGEVVSRTPDRIRIHFPRSDAVLEFSARNHAFTPLVLPAGTDPERWYQDYHEDMIERLVRLEVDDLDAWNNRVDSLRLLRIREADGLGSFLGGRIEIFPHQLHVAEQAVKTDPVRWLLADEVGLGKTIEACLILSRLLNMRRADRVLIVAPASLTVQWLGELYRKFHQIFVLLDDARLKDVRKDFGPEFNPFEIHPRSVVSLESLVADPALARRAVEAQLDLLVVDEAHRLERRRKHPGSAAYRAVAPLCAGTRHVLLLSATPLEADAHGFFRLLQLLRPGDYPEWDRFESELAEGKRLAPCTSATRREDIGGLPPRVGHPVRIESWPELDRAVEAVLAESAENELQARRREDRLLQTLEAPTGADDPRLTWILEHAQQWHDDGEKMLIFVNRKESLDYLKLEIERVTLRRVALFHEDLSPAARDLEVAQFALPEGPSILISTEAGGEGRNFEFCRGLVLFDLPWNPALVEQRIGRLDRINRRRPVEIHYFTPPQGFAAQIVQLYEKLGIFREPLGGLDRSLAHVEEAIRRAIRVAPLHLEVDDVIRETREARARMNRGLYHHLHRNRYRPELGSEITARIPEDLEIRMRDVVLEACQQFGFETISKPGVDTWYVEFGNEALIDHLPGSKGGSRWLGTFDREEAVRRETLDFFASGHPLVEGILFELEDGHRGETAFLDIPGSGESGAGVVALIRRGADFEARVLDFAGNRRVEWRRFFTEEPARWRQANPLEWGMPEDPAALKVWGDRIRELLYPIQAEGKLAGVAVFRLLP